jgi:YVTN family beta-propeller protein
LLLLLEFPIAFIIWNSDLVFSFSLAGISDLSFPFGQNRMPPALALQARSPRPLYRGIAARSDRSRRLVWSVSRLQPIGHFSLLFLRGLLVGLDPEFTPDGGQVWITNYKSNEVAVFDSRRREQLGSLALVAAPSGVDIPPDGRRAYVTNANANKLTVIDVASRTIVDTLAIGTDPDGVAWVER